MSSKQTKSGKPITTSVPSFAIRFHASGEELEELYPSEEEEKSEKSTDDKPASETTATGEVNKHESSPMRDYLNKFGKRSSSIDTGINESTTINQQTSDPWRIFSEIKGKLTKTVEEKLSEIKSKSNDSENSPKHTKHDKKTSSKDNISDSEEQSVSECSIPKSNLSSTAEDLELSSDDENSLAESDKTPTETKEFSPVKPKRHVFKHKIKTKQFVKFTPSKDDDECHVKISTSSTVEKKVTVEDEVESGVEAYEDFSSPVEQTGVNVVTEILVAPIGFVDLRPTKTCISNSIFSFRFYSFWPFLFAFLAICFILPLPTFVLGFLIGIIVATTICVVYYYFKLTTIEETSHLKSQYSNNSQIQSMPELPIFEIQAAKEYQPVTKFEGWINEFPEHYDPTTYHIARTQSVFLKLEGNILRISHTRSKIPKRAMWNEQKHKVVFSHHRIYNLQGSQVSLLPNGLIHKRLWSKKYPICIILNKEKMCLNLHQNKKNKDDDTDVDEDKKITNEHSRDNEVFADPMADVVDETIDQVMTDDDKDIFSESFSDAGFLEEDRDEVSINAEDWDTLTLDDTSIETKIYLFGRTCRDKEDWHRRLVAAAHDDSLESEDQTEESQATETETNSPTPDLTEHPQTSEIHLTQAGIEIEYLRYMAKFNQVKTPPKTPSPNPRRRHFFRKKKDSQQSEDEDKESDTENPVPNLWVNSLIARMLYDVYNHEAIIIKIQDLFQRKLSTIKLPYFIEDIVISDLSLGKSSPIIHRISSPSMDERGLWIDMDLTYEGLIRMALVTKLNLMKLKEQAGKADEPVLGNTALESDSRSPMFHSDVEDSAESSSDEENTWLMASSDTQDSPAAKGNTGGRKFLRMVDKIAASKYFQHATDNKYIKRAMDHVSKTEFKLNVEIQFLEGTLTLNMPPPPSDRIWLGFRDNPKLQLSAHPTFGDRSLNFNHVTRWIEKKLSLEFQKFLVLPNMEDFVLPVMNPVLPS